MSREHRQSFVCFQQVTYAAPRPDVMWDMTIPQLEDLLYCDRALTDVHYRQHLDNLIEIKQEMNQ